MGVEYIRFVRPEGDAARAKHIRHAKRRAGNAKDRLVKAIMARMDASGQILAIDL